MEEYLNQIKAFLYGVVLFLQIDKDIALILISLIFLEMVLGSIKAVVVPDLEFKISTFWSGLIKKVMLLLTIMVLALAAKGLGFDDFKYMVTIVMKFMVLTEAISSFNNIRSIYEKKEHKSNDLISILFQKIEQYLTKYMNKFIKFFDEKASCL